MRLLYAAATLVMFANTVLAAYQHKWIVVAVAFVLTACFASAFHIVNNQDK